MRDRLIDVFTHLDEHISYKEEYGILFDTPFVKAVEDVLQMLKGVTVQEWISVKDRLPEDREWVLVWHTGYGTPKKAKHKDDCDPYLPIFILDGDKGLGGEVTHWMPLPQLPKGE